MVLLECEPMTSNLLPFLAELSQEFRLKRFQACVKDEFYANCKDLDPLLQPVWPSTWPASHLFSLPLQAHRSCPSTTLSSSLIHKVIFHKNP
jgi:hypothetical protein